MKVGIIGTGLIGGSMARALARGGTSLWLDDVDPPTRLALRHAQLGVVAPWATWVDVVDAVVLAVPTPMVADLAARVAPGMAKGAWMVDVSSLKKPVAPALAALSGGTQVLSLHVMAGREVSSFAAADADLFLGQPLAVVDIGQGFPPTAVIDWWRLQLGTAPASYWSIADHDEAIGWVSQFPYLISSALRTIIDAKAPSALRLAGPGYRDSTRVGRTSLGPLTSDLILNRHVLGQALDVMEGTLAEWREALKAGQVWSSGMED